MSVNNYGGGGGGGGQGGIGNEQEISFTQQVHNKVTELGNSDERGVSLGALIQHLGGSEDKVRQALENLLTQGQVYSTIDDEHYRAA